MLNIRIRRADGVTQNLNVESCSTVEQIISQAGLGGQALSYRFRSDADDSRYERVNGDDRISENGTLALAPVAKSQ